MQAEKPLMLRCKVPGLTIFLKGNSSAIYIKQMRLDMFEPGNIFLDSKIDMFRCAFMLFMPAKFCAISIIFKYCSLVVYVL